MFEFYPGGINKIPLEKVLEILSFRMGSARGENTTRTGSHLRSSVGNRASVNRPEDDESFPVIGCQIDRRAGPGRPGRR